ncbi:MAG TPA: alpha/beta hydrolase-fold protein [Chloroflexia bacterium]|nr:alpha/beta hydrolase-fold protein [Chloroflexia bacterium]
MALVIDEFDSPSLQGNPLNDPSTRKIPVYLPPSYSEDSAKRYPVVFMLHGFTGNSSMWLNVNSFYTPTVPERFERLVKDGDCGEMILVFVDGYCAFGGSQYVNSATTGQYEDYVVKDLVPYIDQKYRTLGAGSRAVAGKSSGGFGAVRLAMRHPDIFAAFASHAGDMYFEYCYLPDFPKAVNGVSRFMHTPNPVGAFLSAFAEAEQKGKLIDTLNIIAMAACYSPVDVSGTRQLSPVEIECNFEIPFDLYTGELKDEIWQRWLEFDPVRMLDKAECQEALRQLKGCYLDAGTRDEFNLHLGARIFVKKAQAYGLNVHHEEFEDGHMNINYRYDRSLPFLWHALTK